MIRQELIYRPEKEDEELKTIVYYNAIDNAKKILNNLEAHDKIKDNSLAKAKRRLYILDQLRP